MEQLLFDTATLPPADRFAAWASSVQDFHVTPLAPGEPFDARVAVTKLGQVMMIDARLPPVRFERSPDLIALGGDHLSFQLMVEGGFVGEADGTPLAVAAGGACLLDLTRPWFTDGTRCRAILLLIPRALMVKDEVADLPHGSLPAGTPLALMRDFLVALTDRLPGLAEAMAPSLGLIVRDLLLGVLTGEPATVHRGAGPMSVRARLMRHIDGNLAASHDAAGLAKRIGVSRSALYRAVKPFGGVAALVRERRLAEARRALADPADPRSVGRIGAAVGLPELAQFSRQFRRRYGYPPSSLRRASGRPAGRVLPAGAVQGAYVKLIAELG